jgi:NAD(P)-dependent dehydrogenase (short-subunit alcohol dehydrogenase family)
MRWGGAVKLAGKVALITGSSPNINGGIAYGLADEGARVVCVDLDPTYAEACAAGIRRRGGDALGLVCDVTDEAQVAAAVERARAAYGGIDVLVNGAMVQIRKGLLELSAAEFRRQLEVGLVGAFLFSQHVARLMIAQGRRGCIINILSTEGHQGNPGNIGYGTAKSGLLNFTRAAAMDLAPYGIRVNSLTPTATDPAEGEARVAEWGVRWGAPAVARRPDMTWGDQGVPLGRRPSPRHYAHAVVFLASDDAEMITGCDLRVDGGVLARYWRWNPGATIR